MGHFGVELRGRAHGDQGVTWSVGFVGCDMMVQRARALYLWKEAHSTTNYGNGLRWTRFYLHCLRPDHPRTANMNYARIPPTKVAKGHTPRTHTISSDTVGKISRFSSALDPRLPHLHSRHRTASLRQGPGCLRISVILKSLKHRAQGNFMIRVVTNLKLA